MENSWSCWKKMDLKEIILLQLDQKDDLAM